jgi:hypothetical protein
MAVIVKLQAIWNGFQGAPGYTNWYGLSDGDAVAAAAALGARMRTFLNTLAGSVPVGSTIKVQRAYQVLDSITGRITTEANLASDPTVVTGSGAGAYSGASGAVVTWETGAFNDLGHRVRARSYLVPLTGIYDTEGTLSSAFLTSLTTAATAAVGGTGGLICFSRPVKADATKGIAARVGAVNVVTAAMVKDKAAILRSRRD